MSLCTEEEAAAFGAVMERRRRSTEAAKNEAEMLREQQLQHQQRWSALSLQPSQLQQWFCSSAASALRFESESAGGRRHTEFVGNTTARATLCIFSRNHLFRPARRWAMHTVASGVERMVTTPGFASHRVGSRVRAAPAVCTAIWRKCTICNRVHAHGGSSWVRRGRAGSATGGVSGIGDGGGRVSGVQQ